MKKYAFLFSAFFCIGIMVSAQADTIPDIALIATGSDCNTYEVRMSNPPTGALEQLSITVSISPNGYNLNATLGSALEADDYDLEVTSTNSITLSRLSTSAATNFQLPSMPDTSLTLFAFEFFGQLGDTVTASIDSSAMIRLVSDDSTAVDLPFTLSSPTASCSFDEGAVLSGTITSIQNCMGSINHSIANATVVISSTNMPDFMPVSTQTDAAGDFSGIVPGGGDYLVSPGFNLSEPDCGLDDLDIALVSGYNLGVAPFTSPWSVVSADFNSSNSVSLLDQIGMRRAILFDVYPEGFQSWRIVNAAVLNGGTLNENALSSITETATVSDVPLSGVSNINFIGVKTGDVKVSCNQCITTNSSANSVPIAGLKSEIKGDLSEGGIVELHLSSAEAYNQLWLIGLEFMLSPEHLEILEIRGEGGFRLQEEGYALNAQTGHFHGIWLPLEQQFLELGKDDQLTVRAKVKQPFSTIAEVFSLLSGANIYPDGNKRSWSMSPQQHSKIVVSPNPFGAQFTIRGTVEVGQLRVFNAAGQLIHQQQLQPLVEHQIIAHNWQPGVYFYRGET
ncbi:MAG: T9SS type A sorting domain-containing protein, partial [bacterium]|nr:T9SS type A sorting domain-containing protein [bacterium]